MKIGDLVVHIGATKKGYRVRLCASIEKFHNWNLEEREVIVFPDGRTDWKDQWRKFDGW